MKKMRIRKWLNSHKEQYIILDYNEFMRIGKGNLIKITSIARKHKKSIVILTQDISSTSTNHSSLNVGGLLK